VTKGPAKPKLSEEDIHDVIEEVYGETCTMLLFHPTVDEVEFVRGEAAVRIALDAPDETEELLMTHEVVVGPVRKFVEGVRARLPDLKIDLSVVVDNLSDDPADAWRRLKMTIVDQAKQPALFAKLEKLRE